MELDYTDHARRRMAQRKVSEAEVEDVLQNFAMQRRSQDHPDCWVYTGWPDGRKLTVVVQENTRPLVVVTVWD